MTREEEARYLAHIETLRGQISGDWLRRQTGDGDMLMSRLIPQHAPSPICIFDRFAHGADIDFIVNAPAMVDFLLMKHRNAVAYFRSIKSEADRRKPPNLAAESGMKCAEPAFQRFLIEQHGLVIPDGLDAKQRADCAATKLRSILAIGSRAEINTNQAAAEGFIKLRGEFDAWRRR